MSTLSPFPLLAHVHPYGQGRSQSTRPGSPPLSHVSHTPTRTRTRTANPGSAFTPAAIYRYYWCFRCVVLLFLKRVVVWWWCVVGGFGWFVWWVSTQVVLVPHPVATLGFPTVVYGAGSALEMFVVALAGSCFSRLPAQPAGFRVWLWEGSVFGHERSTRVAACHPVPFASRWV